MYKVIRLTFNLKELIQKKTLLLFVGVYKKLRDNFYTIAQKALESVMKQQFLEGKIAIIASGGSVFLISPNTISDVNRRDSIISMARGLLLIQRMFANRSAGTKETELFKNAAYCTFQLGNTIAQSENLSNTANSTKLFVEEIQPRLSHQGNFDGMMANVTVDRSTPRFNNTFAASRSSFIVNNPRVIYKPNGVSNVNGDFVTTQYCINPETGKLGVTTIMGDFKHKTNGNLLEPRNICTPYPEIMLPKLVDALQRRCIWFELQMRGLEYDARNPLFIGYTLAHDMLSAMRSNKYTFEDACFFYAWNQTLPEKFRTKVNFPMIDFYPKYFLKPEYKQLHELSLVEFSKVNQTLSLRLADLPMDKLNPYLRKICEEAVYNNLTSTTLGEAVRFCISEYKDTILSEDRKSGSRIEEIINYANGHDFLK